MERCWLCKWNELVQQVQEEKIVVVARFNGWTEGFLIRLDHRKYLRSPYEGRGCAHGVGISSGGLKSMSFRATKVSCSSRSVGRIGRKWTVDMRIENIVVDCA